MPQEPEIRVRRPDGKTGFIPVSDISLAIGKGWEIIPPTAPINKNIVQPVTGDTGAIARESVLAQANLFLPGGEQFGQAGTKELLNFARNPLTATKEIARVIPESVEGVARTAMLARDIYAGNPEAVSELTSQIQPTDFDEPEEMAHAASTALGVGASVVLGPKVFKNFKLRDGTVLTRQRIAPSFLEAQSGFEKVKAIAGNLPVDVSSSRSIAQRIRELGRSGASQPKVIRDFLRRVEDPNAAPLTYNEARDFYTNATSLSAKEKIGTSKVVAREVKQFARELKSSTAETAGQVGMREEFMDAMSEYRAASSRAAQEKALLKVFSLSLKASLVAGGAKLGWDAVGALSSK